MKLDIDKSVEPCGSSVKQKKPSELELYYLTFAYQQGNISFKEWRKQAKEWALSVISVGASIPL